MSVIHGTRPGTKPDARISGAKYVRGEGTDWDKLRANFREYERFEKGVQLLASELEIALKAVKVAELMCHGGHKDTTASDAGVRPEMTPGQVAAQIERLIPRDVVKRLLAT